jgi:hypothetical protein
MPSAIVDGVDDVFGGNLRGASVDASVFIVASLPSIALHRDDAGSFQRKHRSTPSRREPEQDADALRGRWMAAQKTSQSVLKRRLRGKTTRRVEML